MRKVDRKRSEEDIIKLVPYYLHQNLGGQGGQVGQFVIAAMSYMHVKEYTSAYASLYLQSACVTLCSKRINQLHPN
jgi:hypothetical protein